jgi:hypothetical protein
MNLNNKDLKKDEKNNQSDQNLNFNGNILNNNNLSNNNVILNNEQAIHQVTIEEFLSAQNIPTLYAEIALELSDKTRNVLGWGCLNKIINDIKNMTKEEAYRKGYSFVLEALPKDKK